MYSLEKHETGAVILDGQGEKIATFKSAKLAGGICTMLNHWNEFELIVRESTEDLNAESQRLLASIDQFRSEVLDCE